MFFVPGLGFLIFAYKSLFEIAGRLCKKPKQCNIKTKKIFSGHRLSRSFKIYGNMKYICSNICPVTMNLKEYSFLYEALLIKSLNFCSSLLVKEMKSTKKYYSGQ